MSADAAASNTLIRAVVTRNNFSFGERPAPIDFNNKSRPGRSGLLDTTTVSSCVFVFDTWARDEGLNVTQVFDAMPITLGRPTWTSPTRTADP